MKIGIQLVVSNIHSALECLATTQVGIQERKTKRDKNKDEVSKPVK